MFCDLYPLIHDISGNFTAITVLSGFTVLGDHAVRQAAAAAAAAAAAVANANADYDNVDDVD
jgi:hypothetical protein